MCIKSKQNKLSSKSLFYENNIRLDKIDIVGVHNKVIQHNAC